MESMHDKIAQRAYELFQARGGQHGYHIADWLQAEKELLGKPSTPASASTPAAKASEAGKGKSGGAAKKKPGFRK